MLKNKRLLIVDDEKIIRESLTLWLQEMGWEALQAESADSALAFDTAFDSYIVDLYMPGKNGLALIKELKTKFGKANVILMSGYINEEIRKEALSLDVAAVLRKPFKFEEIESILKSLLIEKVN